MQARLASAADGPVPVVHRGTTAVYVEVGGLCVGVVADSAVGVPCALRVVGDRLPFPGLEARVVAGRLEVDGVPLGVGRLLDVEVPRLPAAWPAAEAASGDPLGAHEVTGLVGRGDGLTPYGDDMLCGWLAVHRAAGVPTPDVDAAVTALLPRTTLLSATLLDCALRGEVVPQFAAYVSALGGAGETARAADLTAVGHSSGAGLLAGARRALGELARTRHLDRIGEPA